MKSEFRSPDPTYSAGIFRTLFEQHRIRIRQFLEIRAHDWDLTEVHRPDNHTWALTSDGKDEWVQVEIVAGKLAASCYRLSVAQIIDFDHDHSEHQTM
jgi:hypothetical protein